jgi:parallel beta-helix repeat protein
MKNQNCFNKINKVTNSIYLTAIFSLILVVSNSTLATPGNNTSGLRIVVNGNQDGVVQTDNVLTLREAIELTNGTLTLEQLSESEKDQVTVIQNADEADLYEGQVRSRIEFNLPAEQTTIRLTEELPPLAHHGLVVDGSTQPGYEQINEESISVISTPIVEITPADATEIFRGLTVVADGVTIRGLSLYGFSAKHRNTAVTPPADIFIAHRPPPPNLTGQRSPAENAPFHQRDIPPKDVVVEQNWLGLSQSVTNQRSAFGISVFNSFGAVIRQNRIANHDGSGIITSVQAINLEITQNVLEQNGSAGMPDAIRLEGLLRGVQIINNTIQNNAGSAVYLFKPNGAVQIQNNTISQNGRRFRRAAIYLMGNEHVVTNNQIREQNGPGVVVTAYSQSDRNLIQNNQFSQLAGLSIDLITQQNVSPQDYQQGDGANPITNSYQRRRKTGNLGIDAPQFLSPEFFLNPQTSSVTLDGLATPNSQIEIYQVTEDAGLQGPLNQSIATTNTDKNGHFSITLGTLKAEDRVSAIATHPQYGTSEAAVNAVVRSLNNQ